VTRGTSTKLCFVSAIHQVIFFLSIILAQQIDALKIVRWSRTSAFIGNKKIIPQNSLSKYNYINFLKNCKPFYNKCFYPAIFIEQCCLSLDGSSPLTIACIYRPQESRHSKLRDNLDDTDNAIKESILIIRFGYQLNFVTNSEVLTYCNSGNLSAILGRYREEKITAYIVALRQWREFY